MMIYSSDRVLFACRRFYNRTVGTDVLSWGKDRLTIFGISIMSKKAVDALNSKQARTNLRAGLSDAEYREVCEVVGMIAVLPQPELPNGEFSERQKVEHGISLVLNRLYVFTATSAVRG